MNLSMAQMGNDGTIWSVDATSGRAQLYVGNGRWQINVNRNIKAVSCASAGQVWGVDSTGKACVLVPAPVQTSSPGALVTVGGRTGPVYVSGSNGITWTNASGATGTIPFPAGPLVSIAATDPAQPGAHVLWGTTADYSVQPPRFAALFWDGSAWKDSGGPGFNAISIGVDNSVWGYIGGGQRLSPGLYRFNNQGQWALAVNSPTGGLMQSYMVVDANDIWAVDNAFKLYRWNGRWTLQSNASSNWLRLGWDGAVYGLNLTTGGNPQSLMRFNGFSQWVTTPLAINYITDMASRDGSGLWWSHLQNANPVMQFWPGGIWQDMGGGVFATISGAADGAVWGTDVNNAILRYNGTSWDSIAGLAKQVSVGRKDLVWSLDINGNAQRWTGSAWEAHGNPGAAFTSIAALADGGVLGTAPTQQPFGPVPQVFVLNGTAWVATGMEADQVAGTDIFHVAGVSHANAKKEGVLVLGSIPAPHIAPADLQNVNFAPPNPVYETTTMTLSWASFPGAVTYAAKIAGNAGGTNQTVTGNSVSYTLQRGDIYANLNGTVQALDTSGTVIAQGSAPAYYCGNGQG